jgi:hypothetical protein
MLDMDLLGLSEREDNCGEDKKSWNFAFFLMKFKAFRVNLREDFGILLFN